MLDFVDIFEVEVSNILVIGVEIGVYHLSGLCGGTSGLVSTHILH